MDPRGPEDFISEELDVMQMKEGGTGSSSENLAQPALAPTGMKRTPNTVGIVGLGEGAGFILDKGTAAVRKHEAELTGMLLEGFGEIGGVKIYGPKDPKLQVGVVSANILNGDSGEISYILDKSYDIATRAGLHCAPLAHRTLGTLEQGTIRFSVGLFNTREDIMAAVKAVGEIAAEIR